MNRNNNQQFKKQITRKIKNNKNIKKKRSRRVKTLSVLIVLILIVGIAAFVRLEDNKIKIVAPFNNSPSVSNNEKENTIENVIKGEHGSVLRKEQFYNFLVAGCDREGLNTDVVMIASFDAKNKQVAIVQIPRDSYVIPEGDSYGRKINSVFSRGYRAARQDLRDAEKKIGSSLTDAQYEELCESNSYTVSPEDLKAYAKDSTLLDKICTQYGMNSLSDVINDTLGIVIDYSVFIDLEGFRNIVDIIGGVDLYVPQDMYYVDADQDLYIDLKEGQQTLYGEQAEQFIRFRKGYANADLGRIDAQKLFMEAFLKKLLSISTVSKISSLANEISTNVITDLSLSDWFYFGKSALSLDLNNSLAMMTLPGEPGHVGKASYVAINLEQSKQMMNTYFNVFDKDIPEDAMKVAQISVSVPASTPVAQQKPVDESDIRDEYAEALPEDSDSTVNDDTLSAQAPDNTPDSTPPTEDEDLGQPEDFIQDDTPNSDDPYEEGQGVDSSSDQVSSGISWIE